MSWRSRRRLISSVRLRLTLWSVGAMAVVLVVFAIGVYGLVEHSLDEEVEAIERSARRGASLPDVYGRADEELHELLVAMLIGLPIALAVAAFGGYALAGRALRPVEESFERMRRFTADVSHELRTPLTAIRSVGEGTLRRRDVDPAYREAIGSMLEEVERLTTLVDALLTLSRAEGGHIALRREPVALPELTRDVISHLSVLAEDKRQQIDLDIGGSNDSGGSGVAGAGGAGENGLAPVFIDRAVVREALINLLDNAIKYSPAGSRIIVRLRGGSGRASVDIVDAGPGIAPEHQQQIFERFYRVDKARSRELGGAGLGLAIAKWAIDVHGGSIEVDSRVGSGSTFRVVLPTNGGRA